MSDAGASPVTCTPSHIYGKTVMFQIISTFTHTVVAVASIHIYMNIYMGTLDCPAPLVRAFDGRTSTRRRIGVFLL